MAKKVKNKLDPAANFIPFVIIIVIVVAIGGMFVWQHWQETHKSSDGCPDKITGFGTYSADCIEKLQDRHPHPEIRN